MTSPRLRIGAIAGLMLAAMLPSGAVQAEDAAPQVAEAAADVRSYDIASGPLGEVLGRYASAAGVTLSFDPALTRGLQSEGLQGQFSVAAGFHQLLARHQLAAVRDSQGVFLLRRVPAGASVLPAVTVAATAIAPDVTENSGSYTTKAVMIGGKTARDPKKIQQSVSVVTAERIRDQLLTTTEEALAQATGVSLIQQGGYTRSAVFSARGFDMATQIDGGMAGVDAFWYQTGQPDLAILDHIEVLRGSDGLFAGAGNPGGTINLVRKRALDRNQVSFDALAGSWDRYRTQLDVTGPLGFDGQLRGRFVSVRENRHYFFDVARSEKTVLYGVAEADLSDSTLLSIGMSYDDQFRQAPNSNGLPRYLSGADLGLSRSTCLCAEWSERNDSARELFVKLEQALGDNWNLRINLSQQWLDYDVMDGDGFLAVDPVTRSGTQLLMARTDVANEVKLADVVVTGDLRIFGLRQELLLGVNWQDMFSDGSGVLLASPFPQIDVFNFDPSSIPQPGIPEDYEPLTPFGGQKQLGLYGSLRSHLTDSLNATVGLRNSSYEYLYTAGNFFTKDRNVRTPFAGLGYDVDDNVSLYASYAQIFQSQYGNVTASGARIKPIEGDTYEIGAKGGWFDNALTASFALYSAVRSNAAEFDFPDPENPSCCFRVVGDVESRGVDSEIVGQLREGWQVSLGYTYNRNKYKSGNSENTGSSYSPRTPKHLVKLWTTAQLTGALADFEVGGGINWQSSTFVKGAVPSFDSTTGTYTGPTVPFQYTQGSYAVVSVRGEYRVNPHWTAALNVNNLLDETYYQTVGLSDYGNYYGEPVNVLLSLSGRW